MSSHLLCVPARLGLGLLLLWAALLLFGGGGGGGALEEAPHGSLVVLPSPWGHAVRGLEVKEAGGRGTDYRLFVAEVTP